MLCVHVLSYSAYGRNIAHITHIAHIAQIAHIAHIPWPILNAKYVCRLLNPTGLNYMKHYEESAKKRGVPLPSKPVIFMKPTSAVNTHNGVIELPSLEHGEELDYEVELAVVIGKSCKDVAVENALDYVAGYTVSNDVSGRYASCTSRVRVVWSSRTLCIFLRTVQALTLSLSLSLLAAPLLVTSFFVFGSRVFLRFPYSGMLLFASHARACTQVLAEGCRWQPMDQRKVV